MHSSRQGEKDQSQWSERLEIKTKQRKRKIEKGKTENETLLNEEQTGQVEPRETRQIADVCPLPNQCQVQPNREQAGQGGRGGTADLLTC